ncbi:MAG: hypothetical protein FWG60_04160 [Methanomassiliicoccaceae archaeon]|nr:hypothetical protein [Methanomassiliicoccaceae archaeon]
MSGSSSNNSGSPQKGFFKRMLSQEQGKNAKRTEVKQRHPGFVVSNEAAVTPGRTAKPQEVIISPAVRQLNKDGYIVYNTPEKQDIYISVPPDSVFFEDEEPGMVRMAGGSFVGKDKHSNSVEIQVRSEPEAESVVYTQPADIFSNAFQKEKYDEIDFNEVILKKNTPEEETSPLPVFFRPSSEAKVPIMEESFRTKDHETAETSAATAKIKAPKVSFVEYMEVPDYELRETPAERMPVTDVPAGLYVDGHKPIDVAETGAEKGKDELSSFVNTAMEAETALTSATEPMADRAVAAPMFVENPTAHVPMETETACEMSAEETSETVTEGPIEVTDPVADIMKLTIPGLDSGEDFMPESANDWEMRIPDDGLEAYDRIFEPMKAVVKAKAVCAASFGFEGRESVINQPIR